MINMKTSLSIKIILGGVFGFMALGGIFVAVGEFLEKPTTGEVGWTMMKIGVLVIMLPLIGAFLRKRKII